MPLDVPHKLVELLLPAGAEQLVAATPLDPLHCHAHVLLEFVTAVAFPAAQRAVGAAVDGTPFAAPHWPFVPSPASEHQSMVPTASLQSQVQLVPLLDRFIAVPDEHKLLGLGAPTSTTCVSEPQTGGLES